MTQVTQKKRCWQDLILHPSETYHLINDQEAYSKRFDKALKFHAPGLAPVIDRSGAYHIDVFGNPIYTQRYNNVFGFYDNLSAVELNKDFLHINTSGNPVYPQRYAWVGNYQEKKCVVRDFEGHFYHIDKRGLKVYSETYCYVGDFKDGYAVVQNKEGKSTHIDRYGNYLHKKWFLDLDVFHKGYARALDEVGWFHVDKCGNEAYSNKRFKNVEPFYNGIARCETFDRGIALIDESGNFVHIARNPLDDPFHTAAALLIPFWKTETLKCACSLGLFDLLPCNITELEMKLSIKQSMLKAFLDALCEMDLLYIEDNKQYQLTEYGIFFTKDNPYSLLSALKLFIEDSDHSKAWSHLKSCLIEGKSYYQLKEKDSYFSLIQQNPAKKHLYHEALSTYAERDYKSFVPFFIEKKHQLVIDVGGSSGTLLNQILSQDNQIKGILLDLPQTAFFSKFEPSIVNRMQIVEQSFFDHWKVPLADAIIMSRVLHDWSDDESIEILSKAKLSLKDSDSSALYILEFLLNEDDFKGSLLNLNMRVMTSGKERSLIEYEKLLKTAGLVVSECHRINEVCSVIVAKAC